MEKLQIAEYARRGFWITSNILEMADEDCYQFGNDWCDEDWLTTNGSEDLRFFSYHVVLFRRSQRLSIIQLKRMIECHVDAGTLPAKYHREGERIFNPHEFKSWWFKYDMKTYVEELGFAPSSPLYAVFDEMEKIDGTNQNSPLEESDGKVAKAEKVNSETAKKPKAARGRPPFPYSDAFVKAVKDQNKKGTPEQEIPFLAPVTRTFAKNTPNQGKVISAKDYNKIYGWSLRKVRENVKKALSK